MSEKLASYAMNPKKSRGRLYKDYDLGFRDEFKRDLNRISNCASFRRLECKTQVFINNKGDHHRTRLTHSLEVAQVGRVIAGALDLSNDLTEILCLAHDLGHPPFGHKGENSLNKMLKAHGGFNHNVHSLKLLTELEEKYIAFNGLNLTWETLEGLVKHNGPLLGKYSTKVKYSLDYILQHNEKHNLELDKFPSLEAQVSSVADDIAYNCHDLDDALNAKLFSMDDLYGANIFNDIIDEVRKLGEHSEMRRIIHEMVRRLTNRLVEDVISNSRKKIKVLGIKTFKDVQNCDCFIIDFSKEGQALIDNIAAFLWEKLHKNEKLTKTTRETEKLIEDLYQIYFENPTLLPRKWCKRLDKDRNNLPMIISDYIAGMTDRFAIRAHQICNSEYRDT
jgi:dGTPase